MKKKYRLKSIFWVFCFLYFSSFPAHAQTTKPTATPDDSEEPVPNISIKAIQQIQVIKPGEIIYIRSPKFDTPNYQSKLGQTQTMIIPRENHDDIYAGIDIDTIPGEYLLTIETSKKQLASYPFIVSTPNEINFSEQTLPRFSQERTITTEKLLWSNIPPKLPFTLPINGDWSKTFGHYYESNMLTKKKKSNLQKIDGISIDVRSPTPVYSPSDAVCFLITYDETSGYTVLLDHGMGLFSEISGLTNLSISEQDRISKNALIASFNVDDFKNEKNQALSRQINWRVFLNKAVINPYQLTNSE